MKLAFLQNAQQLGLRAGVQVADFVEEDGAAVGELELAAARGHGAGEGAFFMAEEFALEELGRDGRAVHFDKGSGGEGALAMDVGGEQLFAGAGFAHDQHAGIGTGGHAWPARRLGGMRGWRRSF